MKSVTEILDVPGFSFNTFEIKVLFNCQKNFKINNYNHQTTIWLKPH